ncbi:tRNA (5-methylaminomethyl-2-thiouridine)(34)-methyltransferase MnmD [Echinicola rosea]|uniref:MnmC-like methyltransferase domain-containing protein n=1 Tax=Echinicola rosea TaxID=1807691 RepID=A0ABQ1V3Q0_9BACT|nr:tRNA (5-methylaminomethyl-2-thiouridine)(34)-methyltransferase MnmD [Echinicola rosea]GGF33761.1 hypothetical protein GCM10011339_22450 [Echinicola rosea]
MDKAIKLIETEDGSHSLYVPELDETYHSFHGAYRESIHVFFLYGLDYWFTHHPHQKPIRVFEVGFGTGLNAWLALVWAEQNKVPLLYHTIEPFPVPEEVYTQLNYKNIDQDIRLYQGAFDELHQAEWDKGGAITPYFNMKKDKTTLEKVQLYPTDVVFFDAFAPSKQPELWSKDLLQKVVDAMNPGAVFVTYCAKGQVKRDLAAVGLKVETLPGPPGKKEMVRGVKL